MKKFIISMLLETIIDALIKSMDRLTLKTSNKIDDKMVEALKENRDDIIKEIKNAL